MSISGIKRVVLGLSDLIYDQLVEKYGAQMGINKSKVEKPGE